MTNSRQDEENVTGDTIKVICALRDWREVIGLVL